MDEIEKILTILGKHGTAPIISAIALIAVFRLAKLEILAPAIRRVYLDLGRAIGVYWDSRRELMEARRDEARERANRDRAVAALWAAHPQELRQADRLGARDTGAHRIIDINRANKQAVATPAKCTCQHGDGDGLDSDDDHISRLGSD